MKSLIPAALVIVLEAGFIFSIAVLPEAPEHLAVTARVAPAQVAAAPARAHLAKPAVAPVGRRS